MLVELNHADFKSLGKGLYSNPFPFNANHALTGHGFKIVDIWRYSYPHPLTELGLGFYGVIDTPEQFAEKFGDLLEKHEKPFVVLFTHVMKDRNNRGQGGGWRWHKWGEYHGTGTPECEYLDDEDDFENGIYVFSIEELILDSRKE